MGKSKFINIITKMILKYFFSLIAIFAYKIDEVKTLARVDENCPDINLARECETNCGSDMFECLEHCGANTECSSSCHREQIVCVDSCPCHADCPMGCKNCPNAICEPKLALVIYNLGLRQFGPVLYDFQGQQINFNFEIEKDAFVGPYSCGAWFDGEYYIIDGSLSEHKEPVINFENGIISKIEGCSLKKIGELPFAITPHIKCVGIPSSTKSSGGILLVEARQAEIATIYDGQNWKETNAPQYTYDFDAANMAIYDGKPVMIGAYETVDLSEIEDPSLWRSNASYFEVFDPETEVWSDLKRIPVFPELTAYYWQGTSVTKDDSFLVFGGYYGVYEDLNCDPCYYPDDRAFNLVMEYKNDRWNNLGHLRPIITRTGYASGLSSQNQLMIFGGKRDKSAFGWTTIFDEDTGESTYLRGMGHLYYYRPHMILVDHDFCQSE